MKKHCIKCEHYESIADGYGMCVKDALPVTVIADYEPTKNFLQCEKENNAPDRYGEMAYQIDEKTPFQMQKEGWCNDCSENVYICIRKNCCEGYKIYKENCK